MVVYDNEAPYFLILTKRGEQQADAEEPTAPDRKKQRSGYDTHTKEFMTRNHGRRVRHCSNCGKTGHSITTCPQGDHRGVAGYRGDETGTPKPSMSMDELKLKVQAMKEEGMNSGEIAKELGITLTLVNKCW